MYGIPLYTCLSVICLHESVLLLFIKFITLNLDVTFSLDTQGRLDGLLTVYFLFVPFVIIFRFPDITYLSIIRPVRDRARMTLNNRIQGHVVGKTY